MANEVSTAVPGKVWTFLMSWTGRITALIGLGGSLAGGVTWWMTYHREHAEREAQMALARSEAAQGDYQSAVGTWGEILKRNPVDGAALEGQLQATELWVENFSVVAADGQSATSAASAELDEIFPVLESGLARANSTDWADIEAHLGWAHWLNEHIAEREFGSAAELDLKAALAADPRNPYANAMTGNLLLQKGGEPNEADKFYQTAVASGKARPFVRTLEVYGLLDAHDGGAQAALMRVADEMRKSGETMDRDTRSRVLAFCCNPWSMTNAELMQSLGAVPQDEAWKTYLWLDSETEQGQAAIDQTLKRNFIHATVLEIAGQKREALTQFQTMQKQLAGQPGSLQDAVDAAVIRLHAGSSAPAHRGLE